LKISIITTVYNGEGDIKRTIESVLNQNGVELEYIITDGNSTDKTLDVIARYPEIQVHSEPDNGIYDGMNKGIRLATGDLVGILNAADEYMPEALEAVIEAATAHPECSVFHGRMQWVVDEEVKSEVGQAVPISPKPHLMPICHPTTFIRRETYERYGMFDDSYKIAADHKLIHTLHREGVKFHFIDRVLARMEGGGASAQHRKIKCDEVIRTIKSLKGNHYPSIVKAKLNYHLFSLKDRLKSHKMLNSSFTRACFSKIARLIK